ncbi:MAG: hypothetical protein ACI4VK_00635 [Candidatus Coproplasma sp.]
MKNFNELCKIVEELSPEEYSGVITAKTAEIMPALHNISGGDGAVEIFTSFLLASVVADGKFDEAEYILMYPLLRAVFGDEISFDYVNSVAKRLRPEIDSLKKSVKETLDEIGEIDEDLKDDLILISLLVCAIDGKISTKEKNYIKQLIA